MENLEAAVAVGSSRPGAAAASLRLLAAAVVLLLLPGCAGPARPPRQVFVDVERLVTAHPAWSELTRLDATVAEARRTPGVLLPGGSIPTGESQPAPAPETEPGADLAAARARGAKDLREDAALAEQVARADSEAEYAGDLRRLILQLRQVREQPAEIDIADYQAQVRAAGEAIVKLEEQLHALRPRADTDRFFYTESQLRRRLELYDAARKELADLKTAEEKRLARFLSPPPPAPERAPVVDTAPLERARDERFARSKANLEREERAAIAALPGSPPALVLTPPLALALAPAAAGSGKLAAAIPSGRDEGAAREAQRNISRQAALRALAEQRRLLEGRINQETVIACRDVMRDLDLQPARAPARHIPDATRRVLAALRVYFAGPRPAPARAAR